MRAPGAILDAVAFWRAVFALGLGLGAGWVAARVHLPLPWMLGPMIGCTIAALAGAPIHPPVRLRPLVIPAIGVMLGSTITAEVLAGVARWWATMALLVPFLIVTAAASYTVYRRIGRFDPTTAFFSAMPGGLNDMLVMGAAEGGDERRIALAHASRILVVISFVVLFYGLVLGVTSGGPAGNWVALGALSGRDWLVLGLAGLVGTLVAQRLNMPAGQVFGPMILSGAAHVSGIVTTAPPTVIVITAQLVIGTVIGCRFVGVAPFEVLRNVALGVVSSLVMIAVAVVFSVIVQRLTGVDLAQAFLAYSPGGLAEMSLLALAMHQDVAYVTVTHVVRLVLVIGGAGWLFRALRRV